MKILVVNNMQPFVRGGAEELADHLVSNLKQFGHQAELMRIPFSYHSPEKIYDQMLACRMMRIVEVDRVIALKFPAYMIPHHNRVMWLVHQYRQAYDLWGTPHSNIPSDMEGQLLRQCIRQADIECFQCSKKIFVISEVVQQRLRDFNEIQSQVLNPPVNDPSNFVCREYGDYLFCGGRINSMKRQHILVEAMRFVRSPAKILIGGPADSPADATRLRSLVERYQLNDRVSLDIGFLPRPRIGDYVSRSLGCIYMPVEEEYGYCTIEAFQASKAVLTANDSGGVLGLVRPDESGWVCAAEPNEIAATIDTIFQERNRTIELGQASHSLLNKLDLTWEQTVQKLTA